MPRGRVPRDPKPRRHINAKIAADLYDGIKQHSDNVSHVVEESIKLWLERQVKAKGEKKELCPA